MAPKKKDDGPKQRPILGRFRHNLKMGIVGLPNVGKSTLFNTLTKLNIPAENYPFCTIEPNEARVLLDDPRFDFLCDVHQPASKVSTYLEVWDIAGLVKGASDGAGLGSEFLSNINAVDGIFHVCRVFDDADVIHVEGGVDPIRDLQIISDELVLKDLQKVNQILPDLQQKITRLGHGAPKEMKKEEETLIKVQNVLEGQKKPVRCVDWTAAEIEFLNRHLFLTAKPGIFLVNMSEKDYARKKNKWLPKIKEWVDENANGEPIIPISAFLEAKLVDLEQNEGPEAVKSYCEENKVQTQLKKVIKLGFTTLQLIYFFTAGSDEVKCWTIRKGTLAPGAAGTIHTDFEKGFICAEVMAFEDFKELKTEAAVKAAGKYKQQGKNYEVQDGDIIFFKFNVASGGKAAKK